MSNEMTNKELEKRLDLIWCRAGRTKKQALIELAAYVNTLVAEAEARGRIWGQTWESHED